ncbi:helix-turn-helix domain-containing protein [Microbacterium istanbulense]|uniref:Helix-turn-helix domain-containing protein n=1 Tax=Microbacterium istanbulense TaxID=3122049 RepID=A0ABU8LLJ6_9MICO
MTVAAVKSAAGASAPAKARNPNRTAPEVEAQVVELARAGKSRNFVSKSLKLHPSTVTRIAREAGVEWAKVTGPGSNGTPEAMARARGVQSQHARNRRAVISERILDEQERALDLLAKCNVPRDYALLSQSLANQAKSYESLTAQDRNAAPDLSHIASTFDMLLMGLRATSIEVPPEQGSFEE